MQCSRFATRLLLLLSFTITLVCAQLRSLQSTESTTTSSAAIATSNVTFYNDAFTPGADPYAFYDQPSGLYYSYSTFGQSQGWLFAIYSSPDLSTWHKEDGGAMRACKDGGKGNQTGQACWAKDWQWAPEVYHNAKTGWYFIFFAGRLRDDLRKDYFRYSKYLEPSKIGVAVSRSPKGPFREIEDKPIDYYPFDPYIHDLNLIMGDSQVKPPSSQSIGKTAPKGSFIPSIDANLYISPNAESIYFYFARTAYRNWVWDPVLKKYITESNICGVQLTTDWWHDPDASTMPTIVDSEKNRFAKYAEPLPDNITDYNNVGEVGEPPRMDGWHSIISYRADPQDWENANVNDYNDSNGTEADWRITEGSTTISRARPNGNLVYITTYSCNGFTTTHYGVGYAVSDHPLGPYKKSASNPILSSKYQYDAPIISPGHGSFVNTRPISPQHETQTTFVAQGGSGAQGGIMPSKRSSPGADVSSDPQQVMYETPDGIDLYYVHHARNMTQDVPRALYTTSVRLSIGDKAEGDTPRSDGEGEDIDSAEEGVDVESVQLKMHLTGLDQPVPQRTTPIMMHLDSEKVTCSGRNVLVEVAVMADSGAGFDLSQPSNRIALRGFFDQQEMPLLITLLEDDQTSLAVFRGDSSIFSTTGTLLYQRLSSDGTWHDVVGRPVHC